MPELPEVETVRRTLSELLVGRTIASVEVRLARIVQRMEPEMFERELAGQTIRQVGRKGKLLIVRMDDISLVSHLRMEGRYGLYDSAEPIERHTHVIFSFNDNKQLRYKDVRQFGTMELFRLGREMESPPLSKLGAEPLDASFTVEQFKRILKGRATKIKPLLLNQAFVSGIGNIYADESLFRARIHPERIANTLTESEWEQLHKSIVDTLREAVDVGGSSVKSYVNGQGEMGMFQHRLSVYGRKGSPCPVCGSPIEKMTVGGRGTHYCRRCQLTAPAQFTATY